MTEQTIHHLEENEISRLDILITLAESWKLLVLGPLVAGLLAAGLSFLWPKTFESVTIVRLTEEELALLYAAPVLDPLIEKFGFLQNAGGVRDDARAELKKNFSYTTDKKTKLATLVTKGRTPEAAQVLGQALIDALLVELQPKGREREAILEEIAVNNQIIADGVYLVERYGRKRDEAKNVSDLIKNAFTSGSVSNQRLMIVDNKKNYLANLKLNNLELSLKLQPKGKEVFVQEPSLSMHKASPNRSRVGLLVGSTTGFVLLVFVFVRKALVVAMQNEKTASKIKLIKSALI